MPTPRTVTETLNRCHYTKGALIEVVSTKKYLKRALECALLKVMHLYVSPRITSRSVLH